MEFPEATSDRRVIPHIARFEAEAADDGRVLTELDRDLSPGLAEEAGSRCFNLLLLRRRERAGARREDRNNTGFRLDIGIQRPENFPRPAPEALPAEELPKRTCQVNPSYHSCFVELARCSDELRFRDSHTVY